MATRLPGVAAVVTALDMTASASESDAGTIPGFEPRARPASISETVNCDRGTFMAEARNSLHGLLVFPRIYRNLQSLLRKEGSAAIVISSYLGPLAGRRLLDVGC